VCQWVDPKSLPPSGILEQPIKDGNALLIGRDLSDFYAIPLSTPDLVAGASVHLIEQRLVVWKWHNHRSRGRKAIGGLNESEVVTRLSEWQRCGWLDAKAQCPVPTTSYVDRRQQLDKDHLAVS
jgi:hypothetical protein